MTLYRGVHPNGHPFGKRSSVKLTHATVWPTMDLRGLPLHWGVERWHRSEKAAGIYVCKQRRAGRTVSSVVLEEQS